VLKLNRFNLHSICDRVETRLKHWRRRKNLKFTKESASPKLITILVSIIYLFYGLIIEKNPRDTTFRTDSLGTLAGIFFAWDCMLAQRTSGTQLKVTVPLAGKEVQTQEVTGSGHGRLSSIDANLQAEKSR
jgi:hypothetical protein